MTVQCSSSKFASVSQSQISPKVLSSSLFWVRKCASGLKVESVVLEDITRYPRGAHWYHPKLKEGVISKWVSTHNHRNSDVTSILHKSIFCILFKLSWTNVNCIMFQMVSIWISATDRECPFIPSSSSVMWVSATIYMSPLHGFPLCHCVSQDLCAPHPQICWWLRTDLCGFVHYSI